MEDQQEQGGSAAGSGASPRASAAAGRRKALRRPGPKTCKKYMRERLARALPKIAGMLIEKAAGGDLSSLKLAIQLSGLDEKEPAKRPAKRRGKSFEELLMEEWRKEPEDGVDGK